MSTSARIEGREIYHARYDSFIYKLKGHNSELTMKNGFVLGVMVCLLSGCSHFFNSPYGGRNNFQNIACDATPPNQPGCYDRQYEEGALNRLVDVIRERL
ncbi:hypothetical protein ABOC32_09425 [Pseudomonas sp. WOUb67]|uniref:hypothetical protein n=1 Tax=Pseudomonas sp. WOUb67 TaxID=3161136 RepID=UPI003CEA8D69